MRTLMLSAAALSLMAAPALAQDPGSNVYGTIGYSHIDADGADLGALTGRIGTRFTPNLGIEGEASIGVKNDTVGGVKAELEYDLSVYGIAFMPVSDRVELFARVGYGVTEAKFSAGGVSVKDDVESWNYGVGAQYSLDGQNAIRGDWTRRDYRDGGGDADVWSLSFVRRF